MGVAYRMPVVVETYKIRVNASMVPIKGFEPLRRKHGNLNPACLPIPPNRQNALLFTGVHRCANQPGMVYIYEKLIHLKPRYACVFLKRSTRQYLKDLIIRICPA